MKTETYRSNTEIARLCRALALLVHAGVGLGDSLALLAREESGSFAQLLEDLGRQADQGIPLAEAMQASGQFPPYVTGLLAVGERTGHAEECFASLSRYYEDRERMDRFLTTSLTYPAILLLLMVVIIAVLLSKVLPVFQDVYASLGGSLSGLAGGLLTVGQGINLAMPVLCVLLAAATLFVAAFATRPALRQRLLALWRKGHGHKGVSKKLSDARFAQGLSLGLQSGLVMEEAVELAGHLLADVPSAQAACQVCAQRLQTGEPLAEVLEETGLLPVSACRLLALGLRAGSADQVMAELAARLSEEAQDALNRRVGQIEPALVISTSLLVGVILLAVMLPLMNIMSAIG